jgi:inhibitor of KinA
MSSQTIAYPRFQRASDHSLLVTFGDQISRENHNSVARLLECLRAEPNTATVNVHPAYASLLISFNPLVTHPSRFEEYVHALVSQIHSVDLSPARTIEVPVCYDPEFAPDLEFVARHTGLTAADVVCHHRSLEYLVYFIGFAPGFAYLGDLPRELAVPRLPTPRLVVPAGSVALGGLQTGIYSVSSPGGWRIIGRTPLQLFEPEKSEPALLRLGDIIRFREISKTDYTTLSGQHN